MANLTGEYDVAMELGLGLVNSVLAAIHENEDEAYPRLPHSLTVDLDDTYRGPADPVPQAERTGVRTRTEVQASTPTISLPADGLADPIWSRSRPPVRTAVRIGPEVIGPIRPFPPGPRPTCWPKVTVQVDLRAWLRDRPEALPEFLHGNLYLTAGLSRTDLGSGTFLGLDQSAGPEVRFESAGGTTLTNEQRGLVERILRNYIRGDAEPATFRVDLPSEVKHFEYKLQPTAPRPSAMLMFKLTDPAPGPQAAGSVSAGFLPAGADFAVAIGRDYLLGVIRPALLEGQPDQFTASDTGYSARVHPDWNGATFDLQPGQIIFSVSGTGSVTYGFGWFSTTDDFSFTIRVPVTLQVVDGALKPMLAGDPEVDLYDVAVFEGTIRDKARDAIKAQFQARLEPLPPELEKTLDVGKPLKDLILALHPAPDPGVALTGVEIRTDGVVVAGAVALAPTRPVEVRRADLNGLSDAFLSWIPGGTITRFVWGSHVEEHRFVADKPLAVFGGLRCLSVQGTRVTRGGGVTSVSADDCPVVVAALPIPGDLPTPPAPCRRPLLPLLADSPEGRVEVVGHYDPWASGLVPPGGPTNLLVHFTEGPWAETAKALGKALSATRNRDAAVVVVGVVEASLLGQAAGADLEADATLLLTEDPSGGWAAAFGIPKPPATVLVGPAGEVRWKDEGPLDPAKLGKTLDRQLESGGTVSWLPLQVTARAGDPAPDAPLRLGDGRELPLRRLRAGAAVLCFWTSCSEPSIKQLRELRQALESTDGDRPYIFGIGDGEGPDQVARLAKLEQLPFPLIADPERSIARRFGISSWPATVQVGPQRRIVAADLGLVPGLNPCAQTTWPPVVRGE
jgi:peroxiredoxin